MRRYFKCILFAFVLKYLKINIYIHVPLEMSATEIPLSLVNMSGAWKTRKLTTKLDGGSLGMQDPIQM